MQVPQVQIQTTEAKLGLRTQNAKVTLQQPKADVSIQQPEADLSIKQHPPKLSIDQSNAWRNLDLKNVFERTRELAKHGNQTWSENLAKMAQEGDQMMRIENKGNPIASIAKRSGHWNFDIQVGGMPVYDLVSIDYQPGKAEINAQANQPNIKATPYNPEFTYKRGQVNSQMKQHSSINIDVKNLKFKGTQGFEMTI
ncbi:hypothetical protein GLW08_11715 [Pontibacillus yanchengensis]|uniref:Uncharacterized protein n=1 Tax=Pontibacillus yanchengensis TaxID=462910 RepID=A0ACC7VH33_9BACI|nr:DUF6470 family protein [Pontibacillus yanchengensis]MYL54005.1 hypothetical protein [Pontibacillus yanchengensis]